jgi:hypothetical protein
LTPRFALRDLSAGLGLFAATACVVLWQNAHVAVLWDTSYVLDSAARMAAGQMPYRDFPFVHPPLTFLVQAAIIRFTGRVFFHHVIYAAVVGGLGTVLTLRIALASLRGRDDVGSSRGREMAAPSAISAVALLVAAPLTVLGIYSIIPIPEYDGDCAFWILVALWLLQRAQAKRTVASGLAAGVGICVPFFFKQNMGLPFFAAVIGAVLVVLAFTRIRRGQAKVDSPEKRTLLAILAGACAALAAAALILHWIVGIGSYLHWTIEFAGERRLPGLGNMFAVFRDPSLLWTLPCVLVGLALLRFATEKFRWARIAAFALLTAPFIFTLASLLIYDDADERGDSLLTLWPLLLLLAAALAIANLFRLRRQPLLRAFFPIIILAAIGGTFMSQQLWGSTYAIWPLLALIIAELLAFLAPLGSGGGSPRFARMLVPALAALISITLIVCGGFYIASEERLSYVNFPDGPVQHSAFPQLAGMSTPGPYLSQFDELLRYAQANIP